MALVASFKFSLAFRRSASEFLRVRVASKRFSRSRSKEKAEFTRTEAECSKEKAEEEAYDAGVAETEATLKA